MRPFLPLLMIFLPAMARADVLVLKDGRKIAGDVCEEESRFVVRVNGQELMFAREEVERRCKTPAELLGDSQKLLDEAKKLYLEAVALTDEKKAESLLREALPKVTKAREAYSEARDLFPDGHPELDAALVEIMKLMRLVRERIGSELARSSAPLRPPLPPPDPPPAPVEPDRPAPTQPDRPSPPVVKGPSVAEALGGILAVVASPEKRADALAREQARLTLIRSSAEGDPLKPFVSAFDVFLRRDDRDWRLLLDVVKVKSARIDETFSGRLTRGGETAWTLASSKGDLRGRKSADGWKIVLPNGSEITATALDIQEGQRSAAWDAFHEYLSGDHLKDLSSFTPDRHLTEAAFLLGRASTGDGPQPAMLLFAGAHLDVALAGRASPDVVVGMGRAFGWRRADDSAAVGTNRGLAIRSYHRWVAVGMYDLGAVELQAAFKADGDPTTGYAAAVLTLLRSLLTNANYERAAVAFEKLVPRAPTPRWQDHARAMAKSIRVSAPCRACGGTREVRCNICLGNLKTNLQCRPCGGSGRFFNPFKGGDEPCKSCKGQGSFKDADCPKCRRSARERPTGIIPCKASGCGKKTGIPELATFCTVTPCSLCEGRGLFFDRLAITCPSCDGLGLLLAPKSDPSKTLR